MMRMRCYEINHREGYEAQYHHLEQLFVMVLHEAEDAFKPTSVSLQTLPIG